MSGPVELVCDAHALTGEGPLWDEQNGLLRWVDIPSQQLHAFDPVSGTNSTVALPQPVGAIVLRKSGGLAAAARDGFCRLDPETGELSLIAEIPDDHTLIRMNDGKCDEKGRFWAGTMAFDSTPEAARLYCLDPAGGMRTMLTGCTISNGLGWSPDGRTMYYIDTPRRKVEAFDFDADEGVISHRREIVRFGGGEGWPDGMTVDEDGYLWVAMFYGSAVRRFAPDGAPDDVIELPVRDVTCPQFGGDDLKDLYITTGCLQQDPSVRSQAGEGGLYRVRADVAGLPAHAFAG